MIVTVEPGCYFIDMMFNRGAKEWKIPLQYVNMEKVKEYAEVGGVRVEDDIIITATGSENVAKVFFHTRKQSNSYREQLKKSKRVWLEKIGK